MTLTELCCGSAAAALATGWSLVEVGESTGRCSGGGQLCNSLVTGRLLYSHDKRVVSLVTTIQATKQAETEHPSSALTHHWTTSKFIRFGFLVHCYVH